MRTGNRDGYGGDRWGDKNVVERVRCGGARVGLPRTAVSDRGFYDKNVMVCVLTSCVKLRVFFFAFSADPLAYPPT